jgi:hypothetical protein
MSPTLVFTAKFIFSLLLSGLIWLVLRYRTALDARVRGHEIRWLLALWVLMRLVPFGGIFLLLGEAPRGDIPFFWSNATDALQGKLVYRDYISYHAPLFTYLLALPLRLWADARALVALMVLGEALTLGVTYRFYERTRGGAFWPTAVYLLLPAPLIICLLGGQEDIWLWGFGVASAGVYHRTRDAFRTGLVLASALLVLKVTFVFILLPAFFLLPRRGRLVGALLAVGVPTLGLLYALMDWAFLMPVQQGALLFSPNLWSVLRPVLDPLFEWFELKQLNFVGLLFTVLTSAWAGYRFRYLPYDRALPALWIIAFAAMALFQPSAMAYYLFTYLLAVVFELIDLRQSCDVLALLVLNLLVISQPFLYTQLDTPIFRDASFLSRPLLLLEYGLEVAFVAMQVWLLRRAWGHLAGLSRVPGP